MSRGLGRIQRAVLDAVGDKETTTRWLAVDVYGSKEPTEAQLVSIRRALRGLAERGLIELRRKTVVIGWKPCPGCGDDRAVRQEMNLIKAVARSSSL